jgi:O-antigen chain-terminating methyltransferase
VSGSEEKDGPRPDSAFARPSEAAVLARIERGSAALPDNAGAPAAAARPGRGWWRRLRRVVVNSGEHLRTLRDLTRTRKQLEEMRGRADVAQIDSGPDRLRALSGQIQALRKQDDMLAADQAQAVRTMEERIVAAEAASEEGHARLAREIARLGQAVALERQSYLAISALLADPAEPRPRADVPADPFLDVFYRELEDRFRGSRAEILDRLREYLPHLAFLKEIDPGQRAIVDLGCGRGEWLEMLRAEGLPGVGVDLNPAQAAAASELGLSVEVADFMDWLGRRADRSVDLVTLFLREVLRVLKPDGALLMETPNPESLIVTAHTFWYDPTHVRPYPRELVSLLLQSLTFDRIEPLLLHVDPRNRLLRDHGVDEHVAGLIFGPLDYAILCRRPRER